MKTIRSKDNPTYKEAVRLLRKKYRDQTGMFLIEGPRPVIDAIHSGGGIRTVFLKDSTSPGQEAHAVAELCEAEGSRCFGLSEELFHRLSDTEHSQGVIAAAAKPVPAGTHERIVILDRLQDPGNIGTIIRTAEAAGFTALIAIKGTGDIYSPKTARAAAGSLLRMTVFEGYTAAEAKAFCEKRDIRIIASDLTGSVEYTDADLSGRIAIVIGNEGSGISEEIRDAADTKVRIPMEGNIESLNAAAAAGILMYEAHRQKRAAGKVK